MQLARDLALFVVIWLVVLAVPGCGADSTVPAARAEAAHDSAMVVLALSLGKPDCAACMAQAELDANIKRLAIALRDAPNEPEPRFTRTLEFARAIRADNPFDASTCEQACLGVERPE